MKTEKEYKFLVNRAQLAQVKQALSSLLAQASPTRIHQVNYYYDTAELFLHSHAVTLRIRDSGGCKKLQCKTHRHAEAELTVSSEQCSEIDGIPQSLLFDCGFGEQRYQLLGALETRRERYPLSGDVRLDFDESSYLGRHDYEIELEFCGQEPLLLLETIRSCVEEQPVAGKYTRFLWAYRAGSGKQKV